MLGCMKYWLPLCCLFFHLPAPRFVELGGLKVLDGDTIEFLRAGRVVRGRLAYIDTPENAQRSSCGEPLGKIATQSLAEALAGEKASWRFLEKDRYGREIGLLRANNKIVNLHMLEAGWAVFYPFGLNAYHPLVKEYRQASKRAFFKKRGLYRLCSWHYPASYRRLNREKKMPKLEKSL